MLVTPPESPICLDEARVIVPFTKLDPKVLWALQEAGHDFETLDVSSSDEAYYELLAQLWADREPFCIVEHDIVVTPDVLASFDNCGHEWCVAKYPYMRGTYWGLGCTRFRSGLLRRFPDVMEEVGRYESPNHPPRHWCTLDMALTTALKRRELDWPHQHGEVEHLSDGMPTHGCRS